MDFPDLEARLDAALFASPLAQAATLRGQPVRVILDHRLQIEGDYGQYPATVSAVEFPLADAPNPPPAKGDDLYILAERKRYTLDAALKGRPHCWIVRPA